MALKRRPVTLIAGVLLLFLAFSLLNGYGTSRYTPKSPKEHVSLSSVIDLPPGNDTLLAQAPPYIRAIINPDNTAFDRLQCTRPNSKRYTYLNPTISTTREVGKKKYLFTLLLHQCVGILPRLLGSIVEVVRFLGPENCVLSIVEGRSNDGTYEVLKVLQESLTDIGLQYFLQKNDLDTSSGERIERLAYLRNRALEPLFDPEFRNLFSISTTVVFINDVAACPDDILELIHQREYQAADMTCAMDWAHSGDDPALFYDIWISRGLTGDTFFQVGPTGSWEFARYLFWNDEVAKSRLEAHKPFQVYACWNGATAFTAAPLLHGHVRFRANFDGECFQGEPTLFCKDLWRSGYRKIAVVPSVNLQYTDETGKRIKKEKGYVGDLVKLENSAAGGNLKINWQMEPPKLVKCMPSFDAQVFVPWNEGFTGEENS